jgi:hypothetical protein
MDSNMIITLHTVHAGFFKFNVLETSSVWNGTMMFFWVVTPCRLDGRYNFGVMYCLHLQSTCKSTWYHNPEKQSSPSPPSEPLISETPYLKKNLKQWTVSKTKTTFMTKYHYQKHLDLNMDFFPFLFH